MHVAIAGGGLAGMSAAVFLVERGHRVTLVERRPSLGGRTHALPSPQAGDIVDNGQHVLLAGYRQVRRFLRAIGTEHLVRFDSTLALPFRDPRAGLTWLRAPRLPGPLGRLGPALAMLGLGNVPLADRLRAMRALPSLARLERGVPDALDALTADEWLRQLGAPPSLRRAFWDPFIVSTLNEKPERVSAHLLATVLRWGFLSHPDDGRLGYPTVDLDTLFVRPARALLEARGAEVQCGRGVVDVLLDGKTARALALSDGATLAADAFVLALPHRPMARLATAGALAGEPFFAPVARIGSAPIVAVNLWLDRALPTENAYEGLLDCTIEWVFDRGKMHPARAGQGHYYTLIVSASWALEGRTQAEIVDEAMASLALHYPTVRAARVLHQSVVRHPDATFSGAPGMRALRLPQATPIANLFLAGDWTDTDLPSTMEGAVESAARAVDALTRRTWEGIPAASSRAPRSTDLRRSAAAPPSARE
jgi:squalene-associated FAD-dependent desaturase